jgi:hypothetical protein
VNSLPLFEALGELSETAAVKHDPGGKIASPLAAGMIGDAEFAGDNDEHRLWLYRQWVPGARGGVPYVLKIGMNPSTARHDVNDPTVTREVNFAKSWGFGAYYKGNVGSYRSTDPDGLRRAAVPSHPHNLETILVLARDAAKIVVCYGVMPKNVQHLAEEMLAALIAEGHELWCFGTTLRGHPRHPLYLAADTQLVRFIPPKKEEERR